MKEAGPLLPSATGPERNPKKVTIRGLCLVALACYGSSALIQSLADNVDNIGPISAVVREAVSERYDSFSALLEGSSSTKQCPQADVLIPNENGKMWDTVGTTIGSEAYKQRAVNWLAGAVQIPTESFDGMPPPGQDSRWEIFGALHDYILKAFPLVHANLQLTKVNTYGLLYIWTGSDTSLKPILLMGHQDVVPVELTTINQWKFPPFSGHFDGERIWGRGSADDKSGTIGVLSAIETLLEKSFKPTRTVVLAFGFDEETSGYYGASQLSDAILDIYGENAFAFIIDEGGGYEEQYGTTFATPGIAEKGYFDTRVEVNMPGGHSSIPPLHTSIGLLSALIVHVEANPYDARLTRTDPLYSTMQCMAEHGKTIPSGLRKTIKNASQSKKGLHAMEKALFVDPVNKNKVGTTQAIDLIHGGVKINALPEQAWAVINHRISVISSVDETKEHDTKILKTLASKMNLTYSAFGENISEAGAPSKGSLVLSDAFGHALEPAPVTPTGEHDAPYQLLSGTIKATFNAHRNLEGSDNVVVSPGMSSGNTDTRFYWNLSPHIFRYNHNSANGGKKSMGGIHTVNESMEIESFLEMIRFFTTLILNADESTAL